MAQIFEFILAMAGPPIFGRVHKGVKFWELIIEKHERIKLRLRH